MRDAARERRQPRAGDNDGPSAAVDQALAGTCARRPPRNEDFPHQGAANRAARKLVKLAPQAVVTEQEEFFLGDVRPRHAEYALGVSAERAGIDEPVTGSGKSGFYQAHGSISRDKSIGRG